VHGVHSFISAIIGTDCAVNRVMNDTAKGIKTMKIPQETRDILFIISVLYLAALIGLILE